MPCKVAPSLLAADFSCLKAEINKIETAGADLLHLDVMDGHFVPNISFGPGLVSAIRPHTRLFLETHLMISDPGKYLQAFAKAGSDSIIIHAEAISHLAELLKQIRALGLKAGVSLKPKTPLGALLSLGELLDCILFMTVEPGFGGQEFMPEVLPKIRAASKWIKSENYRMDLGVDGGITLQTAPLAVAAGANVLVAGTAIFGAPDPEKIITQLKAL